MRCALCRLDDRRHGRFTVRRLWLGVSAVGFAVFIMVAMKNNRVQGLAFLALAAAIVAAAVIYDRMLRRG